MNSNSYSLRQLFGLLDQNQDGMIDAQDIIATDCTLPIGLSSVNKQTLIDIQTQIDQNGTPIAFSEFTSLLNRHAFTENNINSEQLGKIIDILVAHLVLSTSKFQQSKSATTGTHFLHKSIDMDTSDTIKHLIAGGIAGALSRTVVSPMERMKILFQIQGPNMGAYTGIWSTLNHMWKEDGWRGFMRGNGTNVIRMIPYSASQFAAYEQFKSILMEREKTELSTPRRLVAGALAGTVSVACTYPLDLVRTRLSIQSANMLSLNKGNDLPVIKKKHPGIVPTIRNIYSTEGGLRGLYRGLWPTTLAFAPYVALNFQCYEVLKDYLIPMEENHGNIRKLFCGALAGSIAQTIIYPLGTRFQVIGMNNAEYKYDGTWHALKTMVQKEGFKALYRGLIPNYLKVAPAMGVTFYSYELCKELMHAK
ncbi:MAG: mitochondrial carrier domain-containing protein [Benjaminiella poitrasii]|nr:MAG: mitochondrial carrier domain-containing protein [Benjaminiella poitrasii]